MRFNLPTACLAAAVVIGIPAIASAQGESTDRKFNATGSRHVSSGAIGAMRNGAHWITGMNSGSSAAARTVRPMRSPHGKVRPPRPARMLPTLGSPSTIRRAWRSSMRYCPNFLDHVFFGGKWQHPSEKASASPGLRLFRVSSVPLSKHRSVRRQIPIDSTAARGVN